jgi:transcriptional regulator with XRE-family HTH domain
MKLIGAKLKDARHRRGATQAEVSAALDMSIATYNKAENGGEVYPGTAKRICDYLAIDLAEVAISVEVTQGSGDAA